MPSLELRSAHVFVSGKEIARLTREDVAFLKRAADEAPRRRARICMHKNATDPLHQMVIALCRDTWIAPHRHLKKSESFDVLEGEADVVLFNDDGGIHDVVELGDYASSRNFMYRLDDPLYHTLLVRSDHLIIHEITNGPFDPEESTSAPFSPQDGDIDGVRCYLDQLERDLAHYNSR